MEIKAIETVYKGYRFRGRTEARWAVFFDACGVKWEYEPEGFELGDGVRYLPDFLLHDVCVRSDANKIDLWVEVKGKLKREDAVKLLRFAQGEACGEDEWGNTRYKGGQPILMVTKIPEGSDVYELFDIPSEQSEDYTAGIAPWQFENIDGDHYPALPCVSKTGKFSLISPDHTEDIDQEKTLAAYDKARQAQFEFGKTPGETKIHANTPEEKLEQIRRQLKLAMPLELFDKAVANYKLSDSFMEGEIREEDFRALKEFRKTLGRISESPSMRQLIYGIAGEFCLVDSKHLPVWYIWKRKLTYFSNFTLEWGRSYTLLCMDFFMLLGTAFEKPRNKARKEFWDKFLLEYFNKED